MRGNIQGNANRSVIPLPRSTTASGDPARWCRIRTVSHANAMPLPSAAITDYAGHYQADNQHSDQASGTGYRYRRPIDGLDEDAPQGPEERARKQ